MAAERECSVLRGDSTDLGLQGMQYHYLEILEEGDMLCIK